jgi:small GTP-binding protein
MAMRDALFKVIIIGPPVAGKSSLLRRFTEDVFVMQQKTTLGCDFKMRVVEHTPKISAAAEAQATTLLQQTQMDTSPAVGDSRRATNATRRSSIGIDSSPVDQAKRPRPFTLQLWDIAGQDRSLALARTFFAGSVGAFVVCDASREGSLEEAMAWRKVITDVGVFMAGAPVVDGKGIEVPVLLVVNKVDMLKDTEPGAFAPAALDELCRTRNFVGWAYTSARTGDGVDAAVKKLIDAVVETQMLIACGTNKHEVDQLRHAAKLAPRSQPKKKDKCKC